MFEQPLWKNFYKENPYDGFPIEDWTIDSQGWGFHAIINEVIVKIRPKLIIEVGTWKGYSALMMASLMVRYNIEGQIICVDTFLGSSEHYLFPELYELMKIKNGQPQLYQQFLANVIHYGMQEKLLPLPLSSEAAFQVLSAKGILADFIYLDGGHDYNTVLADLKNYWEILRPGGVLLGDDYNHKDFPGVVNAVSEFIQHNKLNGVHIGNKFLIEKNQIEESLNVVGP